MFESRPSKRSITPGTISKRPYTVQVEHESYSDHEIYNPEEYEETKEISDQLLLIRKKHDRIKEDNLKKRKMLEKLKKDFETACEVTQTEESEEKMLKGSMESIQSQLEETRKQQKLETNDTNTYLHMLSRMKKDKIAMEIKANSIQVSLKSSKQVLNSETEKYRKIRETHFQSRLVLKELQKSFISQRKLKDEQVLQLERNIKSRQEAASRRENRQKKQAEIAEAAARDDKDSHEVKLRETLLINKMWQHYLNKKLEKEMAQAVEVEKAFQKIKTATGLNDIHEICERFLTREQNYVTLISAVNEAEKKLEVLKSSNEKARETLQKMQLEDTDHRVIYTEIDKYDTKLMVALKEYSGIKEKLQATTKIHDQILNWCGKILKILSVSKNEVGDYEGEKDINEMLGVIYKKIEELITPLLENKEESLRAIEQYANKKTSEIIREINKDDSFSKLSRVRIEQEVEDVEENPDESYKGNLESRDESRRKSKRNKLVS